MQAHSAKIVTLQPGTFDVVSEEIIDLEYVEKGDIVKVSLLSTSQEIFYQGNYMSCSQGNLRGDRRSGVCRERRHC